LEGKIACFPSFEGAAFIAVSEALQKLKLSSDNCSSSVSNYFSRKSCYLNRKSKYCRSSPNGDIGAFECLRLTGDVAFMNLETFKNMTGW
jgi:hypothetical protein